MSNFVILSGSSNRPLAQKIAHCLGAGLGQVDIQQFSDGETYVNIQADLADQQVYIIQSGSDPANQHLMELLLMIDAAWRLNPQKIVAVFPFLPYRRQERKVKSGEPISAQLVADLVETAGVDKVIILDVHSTKILNFFDIPVTHISATEEITKYFLNKIDDNWVLVAPDEGSLWHTENAADVFNLPIIQIIKGRTRHDRVAKMKLQGKVKGKNILMIDDEVNTAGTLIEALDLLKHHGAQDIYFGCTHPVLSGPAIKRLRHAPLKEIVVTDSIWLPPGKKLPNIKIVSVADIMADAIKFESKMK